MTAKTVLITGCSRGGIGDALAREFRKRGLNVFATARSASKMAELKELGIDTLEMDVLCADSIAAAVDTVRKVTDGRLDILVNNAGIQHVLPFADCNIQDLRHVLDTNIFGVFAVTHAFLPLLIEARGLVASIGSVNQVLNPPYQTAYNASKAAIMSFGNTLRLELAPLGVRVVTVVTGSVESHLFKNADAGSKVPEGSFYTPIKSRIEKREFLDGVKWTAPEDYAKQVVTDLVNDKPKPILWRAAFSTAAWLISTFGWDGMLDGAMIKREKLDSLNSRTDSQ
ncbi:short-chain dehydrogenase/reductase [Thozetella sp. PMI_491]|nr:short-chain dehydrogenase/reductase [Thozetella sp. PMI_491]